GASTLPLTGHIQSTSSRSVPALSGAAGVDPGGAVGAEATGPGAGVAGTAAPGGVAAGVGDGVGVGGVPPGGGVVASAERAASARSVYGTFWPRGSTFTVGVFASGRASMGGPGTLRGVATGPVAGAPVAGGRAPAGAATTSTCPT